MPMRIALASEVLTRTDAVTVRPARPGPSVCLSVWLRYVPPAPVPSVKDNQAHVSEPLAVSALAVFLLTEKAYVPATVITQRSAVYAPVVANDVPRCQISKPPFVSRFKRAVSVPSLALVTAELARSAVAIVPSAIAVLVTEPVGRFSGCPSVTPVASARISTDPSFLSTFSAREL